MGSLEYHGRTSQFSRLSLVRKSPTQIWEGHPDSKQQEESHKRAFAIEAQILERLGCHPRIVPYHGASREGILLSEASHGNLQTFIASNNATIDASLRWKWAEQATEGVAYLHKNGVIHSDLRPENVLVHATVKPGAASLPSLDLWLCDFGGSTCDVLNLDGGHLPDTPFFDPRMPWESTPATDIFSLGSIIHVIMTGYWPFRTGPPPRTVEDMDLYQEEVEKLFKEGCFPDVSGLMGGAVIKGCWDYQYKTAEEVLEALRLRQ